MLLCPQQVLGEERAARRRRGAQLVYRSDRVPGRQTERTLQIRLVDGPLDSTLQAVDLTVTVAGRTIRETFTRAQALATPTTTFTWDGKDAYGRTVQGIDAGDRQRSRYSFQAVYQAPAALRRELGTRSPARR